MRLILPLLLVLAVTPTRGDDPKPAPSPLRAQVDAATALKARLTTELMQGYDEVKAANLAEGEKTAREGAVEKRYWTAITPAVDELLAGADAHPDDPASVEALGFVAINARGLETQPRRALSLLIRDHVRAPDISTATRTVFVHADKPEALALLRAVVAENPNRTERGRASNDLAWMLVYSAGRVRRRVPAALHGFDADTNAMIQEAEDLYDRCVAEYADIPVVGYGAGKTVGDFARGALFDLRHLQVGMVAPEITGEELDGKSLRLGDHRGKAVVLVFSGEWCGPCRGNAPFFRDLLKSEAQAKAPCVVLEVNTDATREPLRKAIDAGEITWPCWFDGGVTGPITMTWGVESFPLIYVLDAQGVIRGKDVAGKDLAGIVARVVAEHTPAKAP